MYFSGRQFLKVYSFIFLVVFAGYIIGVIIDNESASYDHVYLPNEEIFRKANNYNLIDKNKNNNYNHANNDVVNEQMDPITEPEDDIMQVPVWPTKTPRELFGDAFDKCQVDFKYLTMKSCYDQDQDKIGPAIVQRIVEYYFGCSAAHLPQITTEKRDADPDSTKCFFSVGYSSWLKIRKKDHVWGAGLRGSLGKVDLEKRACKGDGTFNDISVYSVRGPKTQDLLKENCEKNIQTYGEDGYTKNISKIPAIGDTTFLAPFMFPELRPEQQPETNITTSSSNSKLLESCIILQDFKASWGKIKDNVTYFLSEMPWQQLTSNIARCRLLSSDLLQPLILSDAQGVPSNWVPSKSGSSFQLEDYFESIGFHSGRKAIGLDEILASNLNYLPQVPNVETRSEYAKKVMDSFPFHLFVTKAVS